MKSEPFSPERLKELEQWLLRTGLSPRSNLTANRTGLYTDFT